MLSDAKASLIEYPCDFPIKVIGKQEPQFAPLMTEIVQHFDSSFDPATVKMRPSRMGHYISLTFVVRATSRKQLDALYQALHDHPLVIMVL